MAAVENREQSGTAGDAALAAALDHLREGFALFDAQLRLTACNARFAELTGFPPGLCAPGTAYAEMARYEAEHSRPAGGDVTAAAERRVARLAGGEAASFDERRADGRILSFRIAPLAGGARLLSCLDVTAARAEERASAALNESLRVVADEAPVMLCLFDADDRMVYVSRGFLQFVGHTFEELISEGWERDIHPADIAGVLSVLRTATAARRPYEQEYRLRRHDGAWRWMRESGLPRFAPDGSFLGFVSAIEDITDAKHARDMLRAITDEAPVMLFLANAENQVIYVNRRTQEFVGRPREEVIGRGWERDIHPDDLERLLAFSAETHRQQRSDEIEYRMRRHDGVYRWVREVVVARFADDGTFLGNVSAVEDVTDARLAKEELARQREALHQSEKLAALGSLLAGVAHELNNPLSIVASHAQLLQEMAPDAKTAARAGKIHAAAERCAKIVRIFLAMARRRPAEQTEVDLNGVVHSALEVMDYGLRSAGVQLELDLAEDLPATLADGDQLQQVVTNLLVNAQQAMMEIEGPRRLRLRTGFDRAAHRLLLQVQDSGRGVPPAIRSRIFEPFFTTKSVGVGTGVGLSVCHGIVESHGGTIEVGDAPGGGAQFTVTLPWVAAGPSAVTTDAAPEAAAGSRRLILVVDDEAEIAEALAEILVRAGHSVDIALDGQAALAAIDRRDYTLVLSDLRMPVLDGPALYKALAQRDPRWPDRMIFITGDTLSPAAIAFLEKVKRPCIEKPFNLTEVQRVVSDALLRLEGT